MQIQKKTEGYGCFPGPAGFSCMTRGPTRAARRINEKQIRERIEPTRTDRISFAEQYGRGHQTLSRERMGRGECGPRGTCRARENVLHGGLEQTAITCRCFTRRCNSHTNESCSKSHRDEMQGSTRKAMTSKPAAAPSSTIAAHQSSGRAGPEQSARATRPDCPKGLGGGSSTSSAGNGCSNPSGPAANPRSARGFLLGLSAGFLAEGIQK